MPCTANGAAKVASDVVPGATAALVDSSTVVLRAACRATARQPSKALCESPRLSPSVIR
jgi:hypothetical protein